jgi:hypothetical protein
MRRNFQQRDELMAIPRRRLLKVGMTYEIWSTRNEDLYLLLVVSRGFQF